MPDKNRELLRISRQLSLEQQGDLLTWVQLAYKAETSVRKSSDSNVPSDETSLKTQDCSCENSIKRRKK